MALRLGDIVVRGEILNTRKNSVHGAIELRGHECPVMLDLTGNCDPDLAGWHFRFEARPRPDREPDGADDGPPDLSKFGWRQIGPTGTMTASRRVKIFDCSAKEFLIRSRLGEPPPTRWVRCLDLEWFSQNGHVVVEIPDPIVEYVERVALPGVAMSDGTSPEPPPPEDDDPRAAGLSVTIVETDDQGGVEIHREILGRTEDDEEAGNGGDDPFGLVPPGIQRLLDAQAAAADKAAGVEDDGAADIREMELLDDLMESDADVPLCSIFEKPMRLPAVGDLDDRQAERALKSLLAQLALCGIALHICDHFTARDAYRLLVEKVLWEGRAYPQLRGTQWVQNFMTAEYCKECEAESEREYQEYERRRPSIAEPDEED
jgi:hypothetical protein